MISVLPFACQAGQLAGWPSRHGQNFNVTILSRAINVIHVKLCMMVGLTILDLLIFQQWGAADAEIKVPSDENKELKCSPFKTQSRSVYSLTCQAYCQGFFLTYFYPSSSFTCICSKTSPNFFLCLLWLTLVPVQACRIKQVTLLDSGSRVECPRDINRLKKP